MRQTQLKSITKGKPISTKSHNYPKFWRHSKKFSQSWGHLPHLLGMPWVDRFVCGIHPWTEDGTCIPMFNGAASACLLHGDQMADSPLPHLAAGLQRLRLVQHRNIPASLRVLHVVILVARKTYRIFASWKTAWKRLPPTIGIVSIGFQWAVICQEVSRYTVGPALRGPVKHMGLCREEHFTAQRHRHACYLLAKGIRQHIRNEYLFPPPEERKLPGRGSFKFDPLVDDKRRSHVNPEHRSACTTSLHG